jgi:integrase
MNVERSQQRRFTDAQATILITAARRENQLFGTMLQLASESGIRQVELSVLTWGDLDPDTNTLRVTRRYTRRLPISEDLVRQLSALRPTAAEDYQLIFTPEQASSRYICTHLRRACTAAGIPALSWQDLRVNFIERLVNSGLGVAEVLHLGGYSLQREGFAVDVVFRSYL